MQVNTIDYRALKRGLSDAVGRIVGYCLDKIPNRFCLETYSNKLKYRNYRATATTGRSACFPLLLPATPLTNSHSWSASATVRSLACISADLHVHCLQSETWIRHPHKSKTSGSLLCILCGVPIIEYFEAMSCYPILLLSNTK